MKEIMPLLEKLAEKLGTTSEFLWEVLLRQAKVSMIQDIIICSIFMIISLIIIFLIIYGIKKEWDTEGMAYLLGFGSLFIVVMLLMVAFLGIPNIITCIMNPEYWALDKILDVVKGR